MSMIATSMDLTTEVGPNPWRPISRVVRAIIAVYLLPVLAVVLIIGGLGMVLIAAVRGVERWRGGIHTRPIGRYRGPIRRDVWVPTPRTRIKM